MNYQINDWTLNCTLRQLSKGEETRHIRPRTLALLLFFIERPNELITTERLLEQVWDDVTVNEGVVFQSIREIRQLLDEPAVIINFPRKGYQFAANVTLLEQAPAAQNPARNVRRYLPGLALLFILVMAGAYWVVSKGNHIKLTIATHSQGTALLEPALRQALTSTDLTSDQVLDALALDIYGDTTEFALVYSAQNASGKTRGIVFSTQPESVGTDVVTDIARHLRNTETATMPMQWDPAFIDAYVIYAQDWKAALGALESLQPRYPENQRLASMLIKLYIWSDQPDEAQNLLDKIQAQQPEQIWQIRLGYLQAQLYFRRGQSEDALDVLRKTEALTLASQDWNQLALLSDLQGDIYYQAANNSGALRAFQRAETLYQRTGNQTGLAAVRLKMTVLYIATQQLTLARQVFFAAKTAIEQHQLSFLYPMQTEIWEANRAYLAE